MFSTLKCSVDSLADIYFIWELLGCFMKVAEKNSKVVLSKYEKNKVGECHK